MPVSVLKCTVCKEYKPRTTMYGAGCCSRDCFEELKRRARRKQQRRAETKTVRREHQRQMRAALSGEIKKKVRQRDGNRCRWCGTTRMLHVHHIEYLSQGGSNSKHNLITLCDEHHTTVHSNKRLYQPLCRGYIWLLYVEGVMATIGEVERWSTTGRTPSHAARRAG